MSDVLVCHHTRDQDRAERLIAKLADAGYSVWSAADVPEGRVRAAVVESALEAARVVVVLWSEASIGPEGEAVRRCGASAAERKSAVAVIVEALEAPPDLGEEAPIDLSRWRGGVENPSFKELCRRIDELLRSAPEESAKRKRLGRVAVGILSSSTVSLTVVLSFNVFSAQNQACSIPLELVQPQVSDFCGWGGFGERPTKAERLAWEAIPASDCGALREHIIAYPEGAYHTVAADRLTARRLTETEEWNPVVRRLPIFVGQGDGAGSESEAMAAALDRAQVATDRVCGQFTANTLYRSGGSEPEPRSWDCDTIGGRAFCGFEGDAVCSLEERRVTMIETCDQRMLEVGRGGPADSR